MMVGHEAFGQFLNVVRVDGAAFPVPADDGAPDEEQAFAALDIGNPFFGYPTVDGLYGGFFGEEVGQLLHGHFLVRVEIARLEAFECIPDVTDEQICCRKNGWNLFLRDGAEGDEFLFELLFKALGRLCSLEFCLVEDQVGRFSFRHGFFVLCRCPSCPVVPVESKKASDGLFAGKNEYGFMCRGKCRE